MMALAWIAEVLAMAGIGVSMAGWRALRALPDPTPMDDAACPGITVLRPLHGDEPLLEQALLSACRQDYPRFQVVFGVQDAADPALAVVERVRAQRPGCDITVVCDDTADGANRKIANLTNMLRAVRYDVLAIADSDIHTGPGYLRAIAAELARPGVGLVTALYTGLPANRSRAAGLAAAGISYGFLPGAALGRRLGREDCLGATMALRRDTLAEVGGLPALLDELADDNILGRRVKALGHRIGLAPTIPATTVPEAGFAAVLRHELRWARTIRSLEPAAFASSALQYPLAWAALAVLLSGGAAAIVAISLAAWAARGIVARGVQTELARRQGQPPPGPGLFLLPLRDLMSIGVWLAAFTGDRVEWRGRVMRARRVRAGYALPGTAATQGID
jgi:ceramide glucosyltransferase